MSESNGVFAVSAQATAEIATARRLRQIKLSICIPTYNRATFIGSTLTSILTQHNDQVEVVVVDGASTDGTPEIVAALQQQHTNLIYHRGTRNQGVDRDMATSVELARGEYCWLMSSDDWIKPGAITRMLDEIASGDDIYLCNVTLCNGKMSPIRDSRFLSLRRTADRFELSDRAQLLNYLNLGTSNAALFGYMCCIAFKRSRWIQVGYNQDFDRSCYAHVYTLLSFIRAGCSLKYIPDSLVLNRPDNDSFSSQGLEKRYLLDFDGYIRIANSIFWDDVDLRRVFLAATTKEHPWYRLMKLRSAIPSSERWQELSVKLLAIGYARRTVFICGLVGRLRPLVNFALYLNRKFSNSTPLKFIRTPEFWRKN